MDEAKFRNKFATFPIVLQLLDFFLLWGVKKIRLRVSILKFQKFGRILLELLKNSLSIQTYFDTEFSVLSLKPQEPPREISPISYPIESSLINRKLQQNLIKIRLRTSIHIPNFPSNLHPQSSTSVPLHLITLESRPSKSSLNFIEIHATLIRL